MSVPHIFMPLVNLDAAHPSRARAPAPACHIPGQLTTSSALHSHKHGRELILTITGTALPESCFGRKLTSFVFLDFVDGLSQTCSQSSPTTHRNSPLPWEGVALGFLPWSPAHRFTQLHGEISCRVTEVPSSMLGSHKPGEAKCQ